MMALKRLQAKDLKDLFGGMFGFSTQKFYLEYKDHPNLQRLVGEIQSIILAYHLDGR